MTAGGTATSPDHPKGRHHPPKDEEKSTKGESTLTDFVVVAVVVYCLMIERLVLSWDMDGVEPRGLVDTAVRKTWRRSGMI
jgi:hypothetical protein